MRDGRNEQDVREVEIEVEAKVRLTVREGQSVDEAFVNMGRQVLESLAERVSEGEPLRSGSITITSQGSLAMAIHRKHKRTAQVLPFRLATAAGGK